MKKLIAILTIAIVLVGAVFAEESVGTASLKVQASVAKSYPGFKLTGTIGSTSADSTVAVSNHAFTATAGTLVTGKNIDLEDITVTFTLVQTGSEGGTGNDKHAKCANTFYFDVVVGDLIRMVNGVADSTNKVTAIGTGDNDAFVYNTASAAKHTPSNSTTEHTNAIAITNPSGHSVQAVYSGTVYDNQEIFNFDATWQHNPNLEDGTYEASVTVTITRD